MSLTRKASSAAKEPMKPPRRDFARALAEREAELAEARSQQAATAEILNVISRSPTNAAPVFETILDACRRLFGSDEIGVYTIGDDDMVRVAAWLGPRAEEVRRDVTPLADSVTGRIIRERRIHHIPDLRDEPNLSSTVRERVERLGSASLLYAPMLWQDRGLGSIVVARSPPRPFSDREQELLQTFANQAAIAIENARLFRENEEALRQQTATSGILKVIASSPNNLQPGLDEIVETACRLCDAYDALVLLREGNQLRPAAHYGPIPVTFASQAISPGLLAGRAVIERRAVHIDDIAKHADEFPVAAELASRGAAAGGMFWRANLIVPLMREGEAIGAIGLRRTEAAPFSESQIELLKTFSDQAVIAIENARLFEEVQAKTRDLTEALEHQTATSEVLSAISRSPTDVQPVFDAIARSAATLCEATNGTVFRMRDRLIHLVGHYSLSPEQLASVQLSFPAPLNRGTAAGRAILSGAVVHIHDIAADPEYTAQSLIRTGLHSVLSVPMFHNGEAIGSINVSRREARPFSSRQIALLQTFAEQAVIAINNMRLFDEVQARTRDLEEALAQQTSTADVLKVISRSAFDLQAVLDTLASSAAGLIGANFAVMYLKRGDSIRPDATFGCPPELIEFLLNNPQRPGRETVAGRVFLHAEVQNIPDVLADQEYVYGDAPRLGNFRALLGVPMFRDGKVEGSFTLGRAQPGPFTQRQIELVQTFADQAVIAIENVRLFDEVQARTREVEEALAQQTATADVLKVISRSAFDLPTVLHTLVESAAKLCDAEKATITREIGGLYYRAEWYGFSDEFMREYRDIPVIAERGTISGRALLEGVPVHVADVLADPEYTFKYTANAGDFRTCLAIPMLRNGAPIGVLVMFRSEVRPFNARQIEVVQTFADQAVIAIENVRLFDEVQARTRDLEEALAQQTATADVLKVISRSAFDLQAVLTTLAESARELCAASFVTLFMRDGDELRLRAESGCTPEIVAFLHAHPIRPGRETFTGRVMATGEAVHLPDVLADPEYDFGEAPRIGNYRAVLGVPLLRDGRVEGAFGLARPEPIPFTERQVEMVRAFADQAVIAIENARLFGEVQTRTQELAASLDDLRKAQDRLIQSEKLASLGQLTAGIAHEIKNPLNFVNNFSALSRELVGELADVVKAAPLNDAQREEADELIETIGGNLDKVVSHGKRADSIVKNMLLHSREGSGERSTTNINAMVEEALNLAYHGARAEKPGFNVTIAKSLDPNAGDAEVYAQEMTRVLLNLISNGFYATTKRKQAEADGTYAPTLTATTRDRGKYVEIVIRDNGTGIPGEVKEKMFNPFFTTKPAGEGTGLGLSLSHDIVVKQHGGTLEFSTEPGAFAEFTIALPRAGAGK